MTRNWACSILAFVVVMALLEIAFSLQTKGEPLLSLVRFGRAALVVAALQVYADSKS